MHEVFEQQLQNNGLSARQVSLDTGIGTATHSEWKAGGLHPRNDKIKKLADYFGVAAEYIKKGIKKEPVNTDKLPDKVAQARICYDITKTLVTTTCGKLQTNCKCERRCE